MLREQDDYVVENFRVLFCLWKFPIYLCNATFETTLLNLWMLRKLCLREQDDYVVENFLGEYVVENLISNVNANVLCYFVCGNSLYICVMHHLKPLFLIVGCWGNYLSPVFSSEMCTLIYYTPLSHFSWLCLMDLFTGRIWYTWSKRSFVCCIAISEKEVKDNWDRCSTWHCFCTCTIRCLCSI